mgnify:CR=1 FL=1
MPIHTDNKGITLIELLITMIITAIIVTALIGLLGGQRRGYISQQARIEAETAASRVHGELLDRIRMAGYMIPNGIPALVPGHSTSGPDSIRVAGNYENFVTSAAFNVAIGSWGFWCLDPGNFKPIAGVRLMIISPPDEVVDTFVTRITSYGRATAGGQDYIYFWLQNIVPKAFPASSRVSTFNEYTYRIGREISSADTIYYLGIRANNQTTLTKLVDGIEDLTITYETRIDTTKLNTFASHQLDNIYAVNIDVTARSKIKDRSYTHPDFGDHHRRSSLGSQIVVLNIALDKR